MGLTTAHMTHLAYVDSLGMLALDRCQMHSLGVLVEGILLRLHVTVIRQIWVVGATLVL